MASELPTGTITLLFTDIEGSTQFVTTRSAPFTGLPRQELVAQDLLGRQVHHRHPENALAVLAARVDRERASDLDDAARLVDVAVEAHQRLVGLDRRPNGGGAGAVHLR